MQPIRTLGREEDRAIRGDRDSHLDEAEETLVEVVAGCRPAAQACEALAPYKGWADANPTIARYVVDSLGAAIPCQYQK